MSNPTATLANRSMTRSDGAGRPEIGARSLTTAVYERLRADIITNRLNQGERLHLATLQEQFGVSLSVVREALSRLVADGLVVAEAQRGFKVSTISKKDLIDVTRTRIGIESMAIEQAIANGNDAWLDEVRKAYDRMAGILRATNLDQWGEAHAEFHRLLVAPCDSAWLLRFRETLFEQSERYRYASVDRSHVPDASVIDAQHRALLEAVLARDIDKAKSAIDAHFVATLERVLETSGLK